MIDCQCFTLFPSCLLLACVSDDMLGQMDALIQPSSLESENCYFLLWILLFNFIHIYLTSVTLPSLAFLINAQSKHTMVVHNYVCHVLS